MLRANTVFILGAGVSHEWKYPLGHQLMEDVRAILPLGALDEALWNTTFAAAGQRLSDHFSKHCKSLADALPHAASIDNLIEHRSDDDGFVKIAKLAIADVIHRAERNSGRRNPNVSTTYHEIFKLLVGGCPREAIETALTRARFITFNYDRSLERFLREALISYSGFSRERASEMVSRMTILHAYGQLGPVAETDDRKPPTIEGLLSAQSGISTFSEEVESGRAAAMRSVIAGSKHIIVMGCAHHPRNMALLDPHAFTSFESVYGTQMITPPVNPGWPTPSIAEFSQAAALSMADAINHWQRQIDQIRQLRAMHFRIEPLSALQLVTKYGGDWRE